MNIQEYKQDITSEMMALLLTADPDQSAVLSYLAKARILVCVDNERRVGIAVLSDTNATYELKNIAVACCYKRKGIAKELIA